MRRQYLSDFLINEGGADLAHESIIWSPGERNDGRFVMTVFPALLIQINTTNASRE